MINFIVPSQLDQAVDLYLRSTEVETLRERYTKALDSLRDLERYHDALEMIRDHSSDLNAVALAHNVLAGIQTDFAFFLYPARPKHQ